MKTLIPLLAVSLLFSASILVSAQAPPPPMAPDYNPKSWKEYSFADDDIRFRFPVLPKRQESTTGTEKHATHVYERSSFMFFQLVVVSFPANRNVETEKDVLQGFVNGGLERLKDLEPKVLVEENISVDGHAGKFIKLESNNGMVMRSKFFAVKNRLYIAYAFSRKGVHHGVNWENDFEIPALGFLDSIHLASTK